MYQMLFEKFADALFPLLCGILVWLGLHYFVLTPRIIKVEMPSTYEALIPKSAALPDSVHQCLKQHAAETAMETSRWEAALYTASLKHIKAPFLQAFREGLQALDERCGKSQAVQAELARQQKEAESKARAQEQRLAAEQQRRQLELDNLRQQAINEARRQQRRAVGELVKELFGE